MVGNQISVGWRAGMNDKRGQLLQMIGLKLAKELTLFFLIVLQKGPSILPLAMSTPLFHSMLPTHQPTMPLHTVPQHLLLHKPLAHSNLKQSSAYMLANSNMLQWQPTTCSMVIDHRITWVENRCTAATKADPNNPYCKQIVYVHSCTCKPQGCSF